MARSTNLARIEQPEKFNAPLFRSLAENLPARDRWVVLDLGAARTQTIALFGQYNSRLDIADLADEVNELNALSDPQVARNTVEALLPKCNDEDTDLVLCWDIMNYLERPALSALMSRIAARSRIGSLVHALIFYSHTHMPVRPGCYVPQQDYSLLDVATPVDERPAPRYSPDDLKQCLAGYSIERAMLLGNGMQEFLFRL
ncbi:MAG: hypothetical protein KJO82_01485 [Gammaproteobacteria bacterium]|nr:hypothetical protein [Gammaproteobacteria bacterium]